MIQNGPQDEHVYAAGNDYQLARGFTLRITKREVQLSGGIQKVRFPVNGSDFLAGVKAAEEECGSSVSVCTRSPVQGRKVTARPPIEQDLVIPNTGLLFSTLSGTVSENQLGEYLIEKVDFIRYLSKALLQRQDEQLADDLALNHIYDLQKLIRAGKITPVDFADRISELKKAGIDLGPSMYLVSIRDMAEEVRHALFRAGYHLCKVTGQMCAFNLSESARDFPGAPKTGPCERESIGPQYDEIAYESTEIVTAAYTSLDYLYRLFVYVMRRPAGDPKRPPGLHFPDMKPASVAKDIGGILPSDLSQTDAPFAIPNLSEKKFGSLRKNRNDLAHNFGQDETRPLLYIGIQRPPKKPLQYVQYTVRDMATDGTAEVHAWCERFYTHQRDAQDSAHGYLESCWNCALDTFEWIIRRLLAECKTIGLQVKQQPGEAFYYL